MRLVAAEWAILVLALVAGAIGGGADVFFSGGQPGFGWKQRALLIAALALVTPVAVRVVRRAREPVDPVGRADSSAPMRSKLREATLLVLVSSVSALAVAELALRGLVEASERSEGRLFGVELPPRKVILCGQETGVNSTEPFGGLVVNGRRIAHDDLWGRFREDPLLGYAPLENSVSSNEWWHSNNLGARSRTDTELRKAPGVRRILVLGDSFAAGSRVPQESAWSTQLEGRLSGSEIVNLGVDGYGIGQSLLRYRRLPAGLEHDLVLLAFSPNASLWREINTIRYLGEGWPSFTVMPRFVLEGGRLALARSPYDVSIAIYEANCDGPSEELRRHLRRYDRFYSSSVYEPSFLTQGLMVPRLLVGAWHDLRVARLLGMSIDVDAEAMRVIREIFRTIDQEVRRNGSTFSLVLLPNDVEIRFLRESPSYASEWDHMAAGFRQAGIVLIDLSDELARLPERELDAGFDGTHYGPMANARIAEALARHLDTWFARQGGRHGSAGR